MTESNWNTCADPERMLDHLTTNWFFAWLGRRHQMTSRQYRLFSCATCRDIWPLLTDERSRKAVEVAELYVDNKASAGELATASEDAREASFIQRRVAQEAMLTAVPDFPSDLGITTSFHSDLQLSSLLANVQLWETTRVTRHASAEWASACARWDATLAAYTASLLSQDSYRIAHLAGKHAASAAAWSTAWDVPWNTMYNDGRRKQASLLRDIIGSAAPRTVSRFDWLSWKSSAVQSMAEVIYNERRFSDVPILADALVDAGCHDQFVLDHCLSNAEHVRGCWVIDMLIGTNR